MVTVTWRPEADRFDATGSHPFTIPINAPHSDARTSGFSAAELLLAGAGSCSTWDVVEILRKQRQELTGLSVEVVGQQATEAPWPYEHLLLRFTVRGRNISDKRARRAVELSVDRYCSAINTLRGVARIETEVVVEEEPPVAG